MHNGPDQLVKDMLRDVPSRSPKIANGEPLTDEEATLVDATMPKLTEDDLQAGAEVDPDLEVAYLAGEVAEDPCFREPRVLTQDV